VAGSDREMRSASPPPPGEPAPAPSPSIQTSSLGQAVAAHLGWPPDQVASLPFALVRTDGPDERPGSGLFRTVVSALASMTIHLVGLISLGLWITAEVDPRPPLRPLVARQVFDEPKERELETVFLDEALTPGSQLTLVAPSVPVPSSNPWAPDAVRLPDLLESPYVALDWPADRAPGLRDLLAPVEQGNSGTAVVDDYGQALDRITQELLQLLARQKVLVVWCFDQSESMKDDQREIHARLERVYAELGMTGAAQSDALMTAVTSFGQGFLVHTERPTTDLEAVREAIDAVPIDPSGEEMMCTAVIRSIGTYEEFARRQGRQIALILVSDESGNREENDTYLEAAIGQALAARAKVYVLGREAVFGYPFAFIRWVHPQTGETHRLPMDRGPETAFPEVLQTDGFGPRRDAHPSGSGPYAQSRLAWRTGGIFFMLPSLEEALIGGEKLRYDPAVMRDYRPDLRSREEILVDAQRRPLPQVVWKIVSDLDPSRPGMAQLMNLPRFFPPDMTRFRRQVQEAGTQAETYLAGLERAVEALEAQEPARSREPSPRWQADYDLLRAQVVAYAARVYVYRAALQKGVERLIVTPPALAPDRPLVGWRIRETRGAGVDDVAAKMLDRAMGLYLAVLENHPGTPWAARAEWELNRDFNYPTSAAADTDAAGPDRRPRNHARGGGPNGRESGESRVEGGESSRPTTGRSPLTTRHSPLDSYNGMELVPEYRAPQRAGQPGGRARPHPPEARPPVTVPVPKL
jgi:hypothetical protein